MSEKHFLYKAHKYARLTSKDEESNIYSCNVAENHALKRLLMKLPQTFCVKGKLEPELSGISLEYMPGSSRGDLTDCGTIAAPNVEQLLKLSGPSSFGKGSETVYDEAVRKGKELKASNLFLGELQVKKSSRGPGAQVQHRPFTDVIKEKILSKLPDDFLGPNARVEFYKLAIYEPGGHFQVHRDTVHSADHKATLLIEVKSEHEGGNLVIQKSDNKLVWDFSTDESSSSSGDEEYALRPELMLPQAGSKRDRAEQISLNWCIFYTDIEHHVEPVLSGTRMVLQFDVYDEVSLHPTEGSQNEKEEEGEEDQNEEDQNSENDENEYGDEDIFASDNNRLSKGSLIVPKKNVLDQITEYLKKNLSSKNALAIPLYFLYTSQSIVPDRLSGFSAN